MKRIYIFLTTLLWVSISTAQPLMELRIDSPSSIQGTYVVRHAAFGYDCEKMISGALAFIDDGTSNPTEGCSPAQNDLTGKIAMIDRGSCNFSLKAWNAQEAGAVAVIICNSKPTANFLMTPGLHGDEIDVHTVLMSLEDCNTIRAAVPGATATLKMVEAEEDLLPVVWSEDFNDGMDGWLTTTQNNEDENFFWSDTGFTTWTGYTVKMGLPNSYCTGAVGFPSGWYQTGKTGIDTLAAPGPPYPDYSAELISPIIDLSGESNLLSLKFDQKIRRLNANSGSVFTYVAYSIDGGENYSDPIPINEDVETFVIVDNTVKVNLSAINGHSEVRIKFMYEMDYYYWIIDNVRIVQREDNNLEVTSFYGISPYTQIPESQVFPINFVGDIRNTGAQDQTNIVFDIDISKDGNQLLYEKKDFSVIQPDSSKENLIFEKSFTPSEKGLYTGTYNVSASEVDFDVSDNKKVFNFEVTDSIFAKETGSTRGLAPVARLWTNGNPHSWAIGNVFHIVNNQTAMGEPIVCKSISVGISNPSKLGGQSLIVLLYKWDDSDHNGDANPGELTEVGIGAYDLTGEEDNDEIIEFVLEDSEEDDNELVNLEANQDYIAVLQYTDETPEITTDNLLISASEAYNYRAQIFLNTPDDIAVESSETSESKGFGVGEPRYGTVVAVLNNTSETFIDLDYRTNFFRMYITPVIRMKIVPQSNILSNIELSNENKMTIYPNPASDDIQVHIDLTQSVEDAQLDIVDLSGKVLLTNHLSKIKSRDLGINVSKLPEGVYHLQLTTESGRKSVKFVVIR